MIKKIIEILTKCYSRIPVFKNDDKTDLIGILRIKQLIQVDFTYKKTLKDLGIKLKPPLVIPPNMTLVNLLREFRSGKSHMAFITEQVKLLQSKFGLNYNNSIDYNMRYTEVFDESKKIKIFGIVTLEDVIEQIFNLEILDEEDYERIRNSKGLRNQSLITFYTNKETRKTFINETVNEIKDIICGLENNIEMKEEIANQIERNKEDKRENLLNG